MTLGTKSTLKNDTTGLPNFFFIKKKSMFQISLRICVGLYMQLGWSRSWTCSKGLVDHLEQESKLAETVSSMACLTLPYVQPVLSVLIGDISAKS